jgi:hypothetical protein
LTVVTPVVANSLALANVPSANFGNSNTHNGPFRTTNLACTSTWLNCAMLLGTMSNTRQPAGSLVEIGNLTRRVGVELVGCKL